MKIRFLLVTVDNLAGTERAAVAQANALAGHHDVEVVSILRASNDPRLDVDSRVRLRYLTSVGGGIGDEGVDQPVERAVELAQLPSTLVPAHWDPTFNALCDVALERYLPAVDADVVVTLTPGLLAAAAQRLPGSVALVHQEHRSSMHRTAGREPLLAFGPRADALVSLTEVNATWLRDVLGKRAPAIHVVPNAAPGLEQPRSFLDRPLMLAAGRLVGEKQHDDLIEAFGTIAGEIPEWRLRIFGTGPKRTSLVRTIRRLGLYDRVELPGATTDMAAEWAKASISALTSAREGLPLVIQEAFAAGVPVVAYDCPTGPSELIDHGVNGYLVPQGDVDGLAGHLLALARDVELRKKLGASARQSLERYDKGAVTARWEEIYADATAARRGMEPPWTTLVVDAPAGKRTSVGPVPPPLTPAESRAEVLRTVVRALEGVDGWFALPSKGEFPTTVVVPAEHRQTLLGALPGAGFPEHLSLAVGEDDHWLARRDSIAEGVKALQSAFVKGARIEPWPEAGGAASHLAVQSGIRIEFWPRGRDGALNASVDNPYARRVTAAHIVAREVEGVSVPGLAGMGGQFVDTCPFPIDVVYTWVDDGDPAWQRARNDARQAAGRQLQRREASGDARFRNRDELRFSMRSLHAHAPWVRNIFLVTAGQRPEWLTDHPQVKVVDHRQILPADALPTFNSHAIEAAIHRIPGLSEQFVYFNDDVFLGRPLGPERFFSFGGNFAVFLSSQTIGLPEDGVPPYISAGLNNRRLLEERFGLTNTHSVAHTPHPMRVSVLERVCEDFAEAVERTVRSPFRSPTDVSVTASLAQHYGIAIGAAHLGDLSTAYVDITRAKVKQRLKRLLAREHDVFCLGDQHDFALREAEVTKLLAEFFEEYFPVPAPWESST